jgi:3-hydroxyisobutyrate/3-hydroxypropionate dehydrogenase
MVGWLPPTLFTEIHPLLSTMGKPESIFHCGPPTSGLTSKQINNHLSAICIIGTSEAFIMGRLCGLEPKTLASVINSSTGRNYNSREQNPVKGVTETAAAARDFEGGFSIELCTGIVEMAVELGKQGGARILLGETVLWGFEEARRTRGVEGGIAGVSIGGWPMCNW